MFRVIRNLNTLKAVDGRCPQGKKFHEKYKKSQENKSLKKDC